MTATEKLRRLLDERGVEYTTEDNQIVRYTDWGRWFFAEPLGAEPNTLGAQCELVCMPITPAQAVEATLGRGTCHVAAFGFCSECGYNITGPWAHWCPNCGRKVEQ